VMSLGNWRIIYTLLCAVLVLIILSPTLGSFFGLPQGEKFSQLWILGENHIAENYPSNVTPNKDYTIYVGIGNHMGHSSYYVLYVKLGVQGEILPNTTAETPSPLSPLYEYRSIIENGESWETSMRFSFSNIAASGDQLLVQTIRINDVAFNVDKLASWDVNNEGYYFNLFFELWFYNIDSHIFQFHNRFVELRLNITSRL
jgi:hypothetical protein